MAGLTGIEPATSGVTGRHSNQAELQPQSFYKTLLKFDLFYKPYNYEVFQKFVLIKYGRYKDRTCDLRLVRPLLSQLS